MVFCSFVLFSCSNEKPKFVIEPDNIILEDVEVGTRIIRHLTIKNISNQPINKIGFHVPCGCTHLSNTPSSLPANTTKQFDLIFTVPNQIESIKEFFVVVDKDNSFGKNVAIIGNSTKTIEIFPSALAVQLNASDTIYKQFNIQLLTNETIKSCIPSLSFASPTNNVSESKSGIYLSMQYLESMNLITGFFEIKNKELQSEFPILGDISVNITTNRRSKTVTIPYKISSSESFHISPSIVSITREDNLCNPVLIKMITNESLCDFSIIEHHSGQSISYEKMEINYDSEHPTEYWISLRPKIDDFQSSMFFYRVGFEKWFKKVGDLASNYQIKMQERKT